MSQILRVIKSIAVTDSLLTSTSVPEADYAAYSAGTTYALGARVIVVASHKIYESLQAGNVGHSVTTEPLWWVEVSPTNRWKLFDLSSTTQTQIDAADHYEITPGQAINALALINISGVLTVRVRLTDPSFGVVYDQTADLADVPSESSWYAWFFEPRTEQTQFVVSDLPSYPNTVLRVDLTSSGAAYVGAMVFGTQRSIGLGVKSGVRLGIRDYSRKERNDWGDTVLVQRAFSRTAAISTLISNTELDNTYNLLSDLRATPCLWIVTDSYSSLSLFGFFSSFDITIPYAQFSDCSIDIESLT